MTNAGERTLSNRNYRIEAGKKVEGVMCKPHAEPQRHQRIAISYYHANGAVLGCYPIPGSPGSEPKQQDRLDNKGYRENHAQYGCLTVHMK